MRLIGLWCKHGDVFSLQVLIGRGLDLLFLLYFASSLFLCFVQFWRLFCLLLVGVNGCEVPPVPIPNTEVKLIRVEDTWLATTRENRSMPASKIKHYFFSALSLYSSIAQSVEHAAVNRRVVGSSPTWGATLIYSWNDIFTSFQLFSYCG